MLFGDIDKKIDAYVNKGKSEKIAGLLQQKKKGVRLKAIEALGQIGDDHAVNSLVLMLSDPDPEIRKQTAKSMGDIGKDVCKSHLQHRVQHEENEEVTKAISDAIMRITEKVGIIR
jgi:HEAT repeat protein